MNAGPRRPSLEGFALLAAALCASACAHAPGAGQPHGQARPNGGPGGTAVRSASGGANGDDAQGEGETQHYVSARAYEHLLSALLARQKEDWVRAAAELRDALLFDPGSAHLHTLLADSLARQGRVGDAEEEVREAIARDPAHAPARVLAGRIAEARELPGDARASFRAAIAAQPDDPEAYRELIHLEASEGAASEAAAVAQALEYKARRNLGDAAAGERAVQGPLGIVADSSGVVQEDDLGNLTWRAQRLRESAAEGWAEVARAYAQKHDEDAAVKAFRRAADLDASDAEVIGAQAQYLESRRRFGEARAAAVKLLAQRPDAPDVLASLTRLALEEGDVDSALAYVRKLVGLAAEEIEGGAVPTLHEDDRRELAAALLRAGSPLLTARRAGDALSAFEAALRLFPGHPELTFYRALALQRRGRSAEAIQLFDQVAQVAQVARGAETADAEGKGTASFSGISAEALLLDARVQAALARGRAGEPGEACRVLRALFDQHPLDDAVATGMLEAYERAGRAGEAVRIFAAVLREHPGKEGLLFVLGTAQDRAGLKADAMRTMRELLALSPQDAGALNYIGYSLAEAGGTAELAEAAEILARAVELRPDDGAIADSYGFCLLRRGDAARALPELARADKLNPGDPVILNHLGDAQLATGHPDEAAASFRRALQKLVPPTADARATQAARAAKRSARKAAVERAEDEDDRAPDPGDPLVRADLEAKLRALTARGRRGLGERK
jgi:Flp pilus assembly protein TadD